MKIATSILCLFFYLNAWSSELAYVKTDTPRDTMDTFINAMNDYRKGVLTNDPDKKERIQDAIRTFSEKDSNIIASVREKELAAIHLKEVIDRVIVVDLEKVPSDPNLTRWRLKNTEIVLKPEKTGEREGEWLFTEGTWRRAGSFFQRVRELPYLPGSGQGALYVQPWMEKLLPEWSKGETLKLKNWQWLGIFFGLFLGFLVRNLVYLLLQFYQKLNVSNKKSWKWELIDQVDSPASLVVAALVVYAWINYLRLEGFSYALVNGTVQIILGIAVTWMTFQAVSVLSFYLKQMADKTESTLDDQLIPFLEKAIKLLVVLLGFLIVLQNMGVNVVSLLAGLGLGGLAFALAAKDTAANLFGSIMILIDQPFKVGDWVIVDKVEGTVEEVGFRSTRVRTFYNSLITIPNANMASAQIDNMGERSYRRTRTFLDVAYDTPMIKLQEFIEGIRQIIEKNPVSRKDYYHVYFSGYGESSLKIMLYFFFVTNDWGVELKERQNVFVEIYDLADKIGIEFAYPTQTLYLKGETPPIT